MERKRNFAMMTSSSDQPMSYQLSHLLSVAGEFSVCGIDEDIFGDIGSPVSSPPPSTDCFVPMKKFSRDKIDNFKQVIYNLLVESYNSGFGPDSLVTPIKETINGVPREGFKFNENCDPEKRLPELYALHIRHSRLELEDQHSIFIQDLYKFYLRYAVELLSKYFEKAPSKFGKWAFLYEPGRPFFVVGESLAKATERIKNTKTIVRKGKRSKTN
eukprot:TRINITY_DN10400_c0_g1_i1.p1 TRINITY_DN10400_c0_g1~~TRINITY_DN10400_c0_g1_i1.p1  ORF type:complete len:215 (-),score=71.78 TRINITY_DN10400_c0_g1_i1:33-677(-)